MSHTSRHGKIGDGTITKVTEGQDRDIAGVGPLQVWLKQRGH